MYTCNTCARKYHTPIPTLIPPHTPNTQKASNRQQMHAYIHKNLRNLRGEPRCALRLLRGDFRVRRSAERGYQSDVRLPA
eukprot:176757-Amorphochlora_amoeboformis.AAC.2